MDDKELHKLRQIAPPLPSPDGKQKAMHAAMQAFEEVGEAQKEKTQKNTQGSWKVARLIYSINQRLWSFLMKKQLIAGTALAGVLAVAITGILWQDGDLDRVKPQAESEIQHSAERNKQDQSVVTKSIMNHRVQGADSGVSVAPPPPVAATSATSSPVIFSAPVKSALTKKEQFMGGMADMEAHEKLSVFPGVVATDRMPPHIYDEGRDQFEDVTPNPVKKASEEPVSTFSVDVDTASYAFMRNSLNQGKLPPKDAVRVEELINYFDYNYPLPETSEQPFRPTIAIYPTPWNVHTKLLHIGIKGHDVLPEEKPRSNLVFLLDVSGSMNSPDKLPLLKNAFKLMVENLQPEDTVSIVTYAGSAGTVLEPTNVSEKGKILSALDKLQSGGSTAGAQGIQQAYALAEQSFVKEGVNRVILATDGDFNVGITDREQLKEYIAEKRNTGIFLSVLGFGRGNYNDALMQALAQNGNGNAAYIDTLNEARKVLVDEASSTLYPIAKDVKIQVEFNPQAVSEYRLIGYETRALNREDFNNDAVDAGDIGSGHAVTAIYEITPVGSPAQLIDDLRYQKDAKPGDAGGVDEYAFLKIRYKLPEESTSRLIDTAITPSLEVQDIANATVDQRFAASVAAFGQLLRGEHYMGKYTYDDVLSLAKDARGEDPFGYRSEFLNLVRLAKSSKSL